MGAVFANCGQAEGGSHLYLGWSEEDLLRILLLPTDHHQQQQEDNNHLLLNRKKEKKATSSPAGFYGGKLFLSKTRIMLHRGFQLVGGGRAEQTDTGGNGGGRRLAKIDRFWSMG